MNYADLFRVTLPETALEIAALVCWWWTSASCVRPR